MAFNFTELIEAETKKQQEQTSNNGSGFGYKTVYPFNNGRLEFKFIGNEPSGLLYRELTFHEYYSDNNKQKVPCLHNMYGIDCPICNAVSNVQNTLDDKDIFKKYGFKKQGIMFAKLLGFTPDNYFGETKNPPKVGDIVVFMFPKSVIKELRDLIIEYQDDLENLFTNNTTRPVSLKIGTQSNGFPEYTFFVKGGSHTLVVDSTGNEDQIEFNKFMASMPNLKDVKFPSVPDENMMTIHKTVVEEINRRYFGEVNNINVPDPVPMTTSTPVVPSTSVAVETPMETVSKNEHVAESTISPASIPVMPVDTSVNINTTESTISEAKSIRPPCFGDNKYNEECSKCPWDSECI